MIHVGTSYSAVCLPPGLLRLLSCVPPRIYSFRFLVCVFSSHLPSCLKRARSWRQRNHRRPVLRRLIIGESGGGRGLRARGRWVRGWHRGVASSRFMALAATRDPTIRRSTIPEAWGDDANIAFSVAFLSIFLSLLLRAAVTLPFLAGCRGAAVDQRSTWGVLPLASDAAC